MYIFICLAKKESNKMFPGNMGNMQGMMKKMQKLQADLARTQEEVKKMTVEAVAGGGAVRVVAKGDKTIETINIEPSAFDASDIEMLQDLVIVAVNDAMKKVDELTEKEMGKVTKGMNLPPGMF